MKHVDVAVIAATLWLLASVGAGHPDAEVDHRADDRRCAGLPFLIGIGIHFARRCTCSKAKRRGYRPPQWDEHFKN